MEPNLNQIIQRLLSPNNLSPNNFKDLFLKFFCDEISKIPGMSKIEGKNIKPPAFKLVIKLTYLDIFIISNQNFGKEELFEKSNQYINIINDLLNSGEFEEFYLDSKKEKVSPEFIKNVDQWEENYYIEPVMEFQWDGYVIKVIYNDFGFQMSKIVRIKSNQEDDNSNQLLGEFLEKKLEIWDSEDDDDEDDNEKLNKLNEDLKLLNEQLKLLNEV